MQDCRHPVNFGGLCGVCGVDLTVVFDSSGVRKDANVSIMMSHENTLLYVSQEEAARLDNETASRLLHQRKLSLILDLDQTVIHATVNPVVGTVLKADRFKELPVLTDIHHFVLPDNQGVYYVKMRPGLRTFLETLSSIFELHIYTMGTRNYARAIANIIDPRGEIFKERVLSRDESGSFTKKTIERLFPCDNSMVIVVDDRADVWQWCDNLIKVRPYVFFHNTGDINAPLNSKDDQTVTAKDSHATLSENSDSWVTSNMESELPPSPQMEIPDSEEPQQIDKVVEESLGIDQTKFPFDIHENDNELEILTAVLKQAHHAFYRQFEENKAIPSLESRKKYSIDIKPILKGAKGQIFKNCRFAFSGVIPLGQNPESSEIWKFASTFGAECVNSMEDGVTHLIASKWGTDKVRKAQRIQARVNPNLWIVKPSWVYKSVHSWARQPEYKYCLDICDSERNVIEDIRGEEPEHVKTEVDRSQSSLSIRVEGESFLNESDLYDIGKELEDELGSDIDEIVSSEYDNLNGSQPISSSMDGSDNPDDSANEETRQLERERRAYQSIAAVPVGMQHDEEPLEDSIEAAIKPMIKKRRQLMEPRADDIPRRYDYSDEEQPSRKRKYESIQKSTNVKVKGSALNNRHDVTESEASDFDIDAIAAELDSGFD